MMKKVLVLSVVMLLALGSMASAYVMGASAKSAAGTAYMTNLQFGDTTTSISPQPSPVGGTVEMAIVNDGTLLYKKLQKPGPELWQIAIWGNDYALGTCNVKFWVSSLGNGTTLGENVTGQIWEFRKGSEILWSGAINATSNESAPLFTLTNFQVFNTATPLVDAPVFTFGEAIPDVPEPGSMVAMFSGLVGLVGYGIRRRK